MTGSGGPLGRKGDAAAAIDRKKALKKG